MTDAKLHYQPQIQSAMRSAIVCAAALLAILLVCVPIDATENPTHTGAAMLTDCTDAMSKMLKEKANLLNILGLSRKATPPPAPVAKAATPSSTVDDEPEEEVAAEIDGR